MPRPQGRTENQTSDSIAARVHVTIYEQAHCTIDLTVNDIIYL